MTRWAYEVVFLKDGAVSNVTDYLNQMGEQGWEHYQAVRINAVNGWDMYFKRPSGPTEPSTKELP